MSSFIRALHIKVRLTVLESPDRRRNTLTIAEDTEINIRVVFALEAAAKSEEDDCPDRE